MPPRSAASTASVRSKEIYRTFAKKAKDNDRAAIYLRDATDEAVRVQLSDAKIKARVEELDKMQADGNATGTSDAMSKLADNAKLRTEAVKVAKTTAAKLERAAKADGKKVDKIVEHVAETSAAVEDMAKKLLAVQRQLNPVLRADTGDADSDDDGTPARGVRTATGSGTRAPVRIALSTATTTASAATPQVVYIVPRAVPAPGAASTAPNARPYVDVVGDGVPRTQLYRTDLVIANAVRAASMVTQTYTDGMIVFDNCARQMLKRVGVNIPTESAMGRVYNWTDAIFATTRPEDGMAGTEPPAPAAALPVVLLPTAAAPASDVKRAPVAAAAAAAPAKVPVPVAAQTPAKAAPAAPSKAAGASANPAVVSRVPVPPRIDRPFKRKELAALLAEDRWGALTPGAQPMVDTPVFKRAVAEASAAAKTAYNTRNDGTDTAVVYKWAQVEEMAARTRHSAVTEVAQLMRNTGIATEINAADKLRPYIEQLAAVWVGAYADLNEEITRGKLPVAAVEEANVYAVARYMGESKTPIAATVPAEPAPVAATAPTTPAPPAVTAPAAPAPAAVAVAAAPAAVMPPATAPTVTAAAPAGGTIAKYNDMPIWPDLDISSLLTTGGDIDVFLDRQREYDDSFRRWVATRVDTGSRARRSRIEDMQSGLTELVGALPELARSPTLADAIATYNRQKNSLVYGMWLLVYHTGELPGADNTLEVVREFFGRKDPLTVQIIRTINTGSGPLPRPNIAASINSRIRLRPSPIRDYVSRTVLADNTGYRVKLSRGYIGVAPAMWSGRSGYDHWVHGALTQHALFVCMGSPDRGTGTAAREIAVRRLRRAGTSAIVGKLFLASTALMTPLEVVQSIALGVLMPSHDFEAAHAVDTQAALDAAPMQAVSSRATVLCRRINSMRGASTMEGRAMLYYDLVCLMQCLTYTGYGALGAARFAAWCSEVLVAIVDEYVRVLPAIDLALFALDPGTVMAGAVHPLLPLVATAVARNPEIARRVNEATEEDIRVDIADAVRVTRYIMRRAPTRHFAPPSVPAWNMRLAIAYLYTDTGLYLSNALCSWTVPTLTERGARRY